jgi:hypothetical protein
MMKNFSLFASVWLVVATVSFTACQSDDQAGHAASSFAPQRMLGKSPRTAMSLGAKAELQHRTEWTRLLGTSLVNQAQVIPIRLGPTEKT